MYKKLNLDTQHSHKRQVPYNPKVQGNRDQESLGKIG